MSELRIARLDEVAEVVGGGTPSRQEPRFFGGSIPWATPTDVTALNGMYISSTRESITGEGLQLSSAKLLPAGAVLLTSRATIGFTAVAATPICTNQGFVNFVCGPQLVPEYLAYWLRTQKAKMVQLAGGTTFKEIGRGTLRKFEIALPSIATQRRIVDLLARAEGIVRLRREAQQKAAELVPAIFINMFGDPAKSPKQWPMEPLGNVVQSISGGTPAKARPEFWDGDLPWVSPKDMKRDEIADAADHVNRRVLTETSLKLVPSGSVLIVVRGMILVHTVPVAITRAPVTINQDMKALCPASGVTATYLQWLLKVSHAKLLRAVATAAHGTKKLDTQALMAMPVPLPPRSLQQAFEQRVQTAVSIRRQQAEALSKASAAFDAILSGALSA